MSFLVLLTFLILNNPYVKIGTSSLLCYISTYFSGNVEVMPIIFCRFAKK